MLCNNYSNKYIVDDLNICKTTHLLFWLNVDRGNAFRN